LPPLPRGRIKSAPEDFIVEEIPLYLPRGSGSHLYVRFEKRGLTTDDAVRAFAHALSLPARDIGVAGLKDKVAVTTQTISVPVPPKETDAFIARVRALALPGITVQDATLHDNKLRTGHLRGNRFTLTVRGIDPLRVDEVVTSLEQVGREGLPNAFGAQRFGRGHDNAEQALSWLTGKSAGPRDPKKKRFLWSALQSSIFNAVLDARVQDGSWRVPLLGDLLQKADSGALFECTDEAVDRARAERGEVSPTGPMVGVKMRQPSGRSAELERAIAAEKLGSDFDLEKTKTLGEGARRALRVAVPELTVHRMVNRPGDEVASPREQDAALMVCFVLPRGAYATQVLACALDIEPDLARPTIESREHDHESA
jgi:tRNA pseudouridine13 synthase